MDRYNKILKQQERRHAPNLLKKHGLVCKQLQFGDDCVPLYLAKPHWTNRFDSKRESTIGIFFGLWISPELLQKNQFAYNIHSKTIRKLPGYKLTSKDFATEFRSLVKSSVSQWPGIRLDYGPTTLLEGRETSDLSSFADKVERRILGFADICHHVDNLLEKSIE